MSNQQAFFRFRDLLETRQIAHDPKRDIRQHVLSHANNAVGMGLISEVLKTRFGANLPALFPKVTPVDAKDIANCDVYFMHGTIHEDAAHSHKGATELLLKAPDDKELLFMETSFLATSHSWIHSGQEKNPAYACLGYVYDDIAHYFMAEYPNRIIQKLNSDEAPSAEELARAEALIERITRQRISKYNAQPMIAPTMTEGYSRRVLVCDQAYADASTIYGKVGDAEFEQMLLAAIRENPDAEILVKTHPDSVWDKKNRKGYYSHLQSTGRVRILREPVNPYALFDLVDTVYVGTSQMGFEALLAGKKVVIFGAPFYAGWGLTDDRQKIPHRSRSRSLSEIFHYFYVWYTIYNMPGTEGPAEIEDVLSYIEQNRPYPLPPSEEELAAEPKVSVVIPVHGVEAYIEECIASVQRQTLRDIEILPINDATLDGSQAIIDRLAATDARIRPVVLQQNIKLGMVRNRGIQEARGKYIWFLDGDDWLSNPQMLEQVYELAQANSLDMVRARKAYEAVYNDQDVLQHKRDDWCEVFFAETLAKTTFAQSPVIQMNRHCWTWLYRRDFLRDNNVRFMTTKWEERAFLQHAFIASKSIGLMAVDGPAYRIRANSISRKDRNTEDYQLMLENFQYTFSRYIEVGADQPDHPLRPHLCYQLSLFIQHMLTFGSYRHFCAKGPEERNGFIDVLRSELERCDFRPEDFVFDIPRLSPDHVAASSYPLMIAALRAGQNEVLDEAVNLRPTPQSRLYAIFLAVPNDQNMRDFQAALSRYARNERVLSLPLADVLPPVAKQTAKPRIVIHIGATKTGSTFIQHMLEKNRPALLQQGIWFPEVGLFWQPTRPRKQAGHVGFTRAAAQKDISLREHIDHGLALMGGKIHTIVLSSEAYFLQENAPLLTEYFAGYEIEMVVYLRRQDEWANSQYCEFVSGGAVGRVDVPLADWLQQPAPKRHLNYLGVLRKWEAKIGRPNIHVRRFDRAAFVGGDLLSDFAQAAGLPQLLAMPRPADSDQNEARLCAAHVEVIRLYNKRPFLDQNGYFSFIEEVGSALAEWRNHQGLATPKPWLLSLEQADSLMIAHEKGNAEIARTYLGQEDGQLFGARGTVPEPSPIYPQEIQLIEEIYQRYAAPADPKAAATGSRDLGQRVQTLDTNLKKEKRLSAGQKLRLKERDSALLAADDMIRTLEEERALLQTQLTQSQQAKDQLKRARDQLELSRDQLENSRGYRLVKTLWRLRRTLP